MLTLGLIFAIIGIILMVFGFASSVFGLYAIFTNQTAAAISAGAMAPGAIWFVGGFIALLLGVVIMLIVFSNGYLKSKSQRKLEQESAEQQMGYNRKS